MTHKGQTNETGSKTYQLARRAVLKATGGAAALSLEAGTATAGTGGDGWASDVYASSEIDPIFGQPSTDPVPSDIDTVVDMEIDFERLVFAATQAKTPSLDAHHPTD